MKQGCYKLYWTLEETPHKKIANADLIEIILNKFILKIKGKFTKFCDLKRSQ